VKFSTPQTIAITGASSGIGGALARHYAGPGRLLFLAGRDPKRLGIVGGDCASRGAGVDAQVFDVRDRAAAAKWVKTICDRSPIDLLIANAGISGGTHGGSESQAQARDIFDVNMMGIVNVVLPMADDMERRGHGQIGLMSSLAGYRGLPTAPAYCASKAAIKVWGEGLRGHYAAKGIGVSVIMPGFVATPMTDVNDFSMPFLMAAERAARHIAYGLARNRARIAFPLPMAVMTWFFAMLSPTITDALVAHLPKKR
jgi:short-subunit dehydrogenase